MFATSGYPLLASLHSGNCSFLNAITFSFFLKSMQDIQKFSTSRIILPVFLAAIGLLVYFTPMHSDDYFFKMLGHDWADHVGQYMRWSGRLVADYISPTLLALESKIALGVIQVAGLLLLVHAIVSSTRFVRKNRGFPDFESWAALLLLSVFFLSIPVFGQVVLWVVGSATYMWTAVLYSWFLYFFLRCLYTKEVPIYAYPLAVLAGCSNESASATILAFTGLTLVWKGWTEKKIDYRMLALFVCFAAGAAILVGAPGNQGRMANSYFKDWMALSFIEKLQLHFSDRAVRPFEQSSVSYLVAIVLAVIAVRSKKCYLRQEDGLPTAKGLFVVFFAMSLFATCIMALAPTMPPRSLTIPFVFLMFALIFGSIMVLEDCGRVLKFKRITLLLVAASTAYLVLLIPAYHSLYKQEQIRLALIEAAAPQEIVKLPEFHMRKVPVKNSRMYLLDAHNEPSSMAKFYGVAGIEIYSPGFDYSVVEREFSGDQAAIWRYSESPWQTTFVVYDSGASKGPFKLEVTNIFGKQTESCMQNTSPIRDKNYFYKTINTPAYLIKNYSLKAGCNE